MRFNIKIFPCRTTGWFRVFNSNICIKHDRLLGICYIWSHNYAHVNICIFIPFVLAWQLCVLKLLQCGFRRACKPSSETAGYLATYNWYKVEQVCKSFAKVIGEMYISKKYRYIFLKRTQCISTKVSIIKLLMVLFYASLLHIAALGCDLILLLPRVCCFDCVCWLVDLFV